MRPINTHHSTQTVRHIETRPFNNNATNCSLRSANMRYFCSYREVEPNKRFTGSNIKLVACTATANLLLSVSRSATIWFSMIVTSINTSFTIQSILKRSATIYNLQYVSVVCLWPKITTKGKPSGGVNNDVSHYINVKTAVITNWDHYWRYRI